MSICLADLYEKTRNKYQLQLLAGESGLNRTMNWVYVTEDQSNENFLRTGELIISTGALYDHTEKWLLHFIQTLWARHTCGLILNIGKHIFLSDLTPAVLDFCNTHSFPLFVMPWHIHIYDLTKDYYNRIFLDSQTDENMNFYKLRLELNNNTLLERYVNQKLGAVLKYDRKHNTNFSDTLFLYLKHWGNVKEIAAENYCHRNTVTNRLRILQEQLGYRLDDPTERFELMTAFMVREFLCQFSRAAL